VIGLPSFNVFLLESTVDSILVVWIAGASCLRADFGNFHQRLQRMQEDTGRDGRPGLSDTLIRKGNAEPLKMSGFVVDL
jgi:hypothetical protein